ncbi:hypothetical protein EYF80_059074 [Liparis tanakae]|uniref:Uncharacterized protein n=1 Tax=Liparis tanakae TaxID=230148 RepID=A0A4Z2EPR1_9TELE|nr:hypothetical protein EYF80_059074 [Liparis tanakae]
MWWSVVVCGDMWWSVVVCGDLWRYVVLCVIGIIPNTINSAPLSDRLHRLLSPGRLIIGRCRVAVLRPHRQQPGVTWEWMYV